MTIDTTILDAALEGPRALVQADGGDLELTGVAGTTIELRLIVESAECAECVMPRQFLEQITLDMVRKDLPAVDAIRIDDPRERD
jgi:Fe-S cluster biogenesis protein NfuA